MNFKPTLWKVMASLIVGVILTKTFFIETVIPRSPSPTGYTYNWMAGVISVVVIYIVWSLIQKKNKK